MALLELKLCWLRAPEKELLSVAAAVAKGEVPGDASWGGPPGKAVSEGGPAAKGLPLWGASADAYSLKRRQLLSGSAGCI